MSKPRRSGPQRSTPAGEHRPVLLHEVLDALRLQPGDTVVDGTMGWAGHSVELLQRVGPTGLLIGVDLDSDNLPRAEERLAPLGLPYRLHHGNFAGLQQMVAEHGLDGVDALLVDLGMSSMQVDDDERGFSYRRDGPLDMRMDRTRGRSAAQVLATIAASDLAEALRVWGDEPFAEQIAQAVVQTREEKPLLRTLELVELIQTSTKQENWQLHPTKGKWNLHPAARSFQALRILVNRELSNLENLLRILPTLLREGGRAAIISFHSGEDRLVKAAFKEGVARGVYRDHAAEPLRATFAERTQNPRARSAKLRWACR